MREIVVWSLAKTLSVPALARELRLMAQGKRSSPEPQQTALISQPRELVRQALQGVNEVWYFDNNLWAQTLALASILVSHGGQQAGKNGQFTSFLSLQPTKLL